MTLQRLLLESIHERLRIDKKWTKWSKDSFSWWTLKDVKQTIWANKPFDYHKSKVIRIYVETVLYQNSCGKSINHLSELTNTLECYYWDVKRKNIIQINAFNVSQENAGWMMGLIIAAASLQIFLSRWLYLLNESTSSPENEENLRVGQNHEEPDQKPFYIPESKKADLKNLKSQLEEEFLESSNTFNTMKSFSNYSKEGMTIEFPFSKTDTSLLTCKIDNPTFKGYGISFQLIIPYKISDMDIVTFCNELNILEKDSSKYTDIIGNWKKSEKFDYPEHYTFLPLYLYDYGLIHYINTNLALKAKWLCDKFGDGDNSANPVDLSISRLIKHNEYIQIRKS